MMTAGKREREPDISLSVTNAQPLYDSELATIFSVLKSSSVGLLDEEAQARLLASGPNIIKRIQRESIWKTFISNFTHLMALLLWAGGGLALAAGMPQLAVAIWLVNIINGLFSFWQEFKAEKATEALMKLVPEQATVLRNRQQKRILAHDIVAGDVLILEAGDDIAADARLLEDNSLYVDQSFLTGESTPVRKTTVSDGDKYHHPNRGYADILFAGTSVTSGSGRALVLATGMETRFGKIAGLTQSIKTEPSPLQIELTQVTRTVTFLAVGVGTVVFALATILNHISLLQAFVFSLGIIVAFVPEGMLPTVSLSLAIAVQEMAARNALVKKLSSVETLGCTNVICTDKTGTLTKNEMTVASIWTLRQKAFLEGTGYAPVGRLLDESGNAVGEEFANSVREILLGCARCSTAKLIPELNSTWSIMGDPTEGALIVAARKIGITDEGIDYNSKALIFPFDPHRKRMSVVWKVGNSFCGYIKGSPREIVELSSTITENGSTRPLTQEDREVIYEAIDNYAQSGLRVLAIARKELTEMPAPEVATLETNMTFLALVAMMDPLHEEVPSAVALCRKAGIKVIMITGDYSLTARAIAEQAGIICSDDALVISGSELHRMSSQELYDALKQEVIFARTSPEDKLRIVEALQEMGNIVAVTGDGVNDAPALRKANIGISMGLNGTDVARESSDIVLRDDNFASIVQAVALGRSVFQNIRKFSVYVFTSNVAEAIPFAVMIFSCGLIPLPLTLMQVLFVDLGTDMLPAIGLGADPIDPVVMEQPPRHLQDRLLSTGTLAKAFLWYGLLESIAGLFGYFFVNYVNGWPYVPLAREGSDLYRMATTACLASIVACQMGTVIACRTNLKSALTLALTDNKILVAGLVLEVVLLLLVVYAPPMQLFFNTTALPVWMLATFLIWCPAVILIDECKKLLLRRFQMKPGCARN